MICCLSPTCDHPQNHDGVHYCQRCGAPLSALLRNRYKVVKLLGKGGFGRTFLAHDTDNLNKRCVVKQLTFQSTNTWMAQKAIQLFEGEAQQLQQLGTHPQIPALLGYFEDEGCLYLIQQYIEGKNLKQLLEHQGAFSGGQIEQILLHLLPVLQYIHERGVIHRDIKPDNIMHIPGTGKYVLIDFGVAKPIPDPAKELSGTVLGSPGFAPYEQMRLGIATPSGDLFGLGASCFYLLSQTSPSTLATEHGYSWLESWHSYVSQPLSPLLRQVLSQLLQKEASNRYQSAEAALKELTRRVLTPDASTTTALPKASTLPLPVQVQNSLEASLPPTKVVESSVDRRSKPFIFYLAPQSNATSLQKDTSLRIPRKVVGSALLTLALLGGIGYIVAQGLLTVSPKAITVAEVNRQVQGHLQQGDQQFAAGDYQQALREYAAAIQKDPENAKAYFNSGITKRRLNDLPGAIAHYTTAIRLKPTSVDAYNNRGLVRSQLGDKLAAIADFTEAIRLNPQHVQAYNNRGTIYSEVGKKQAAIADYSQAIQIDAQYYEAYFNRGIVQSDLGNTKAAIADYSQVLRLNVNYAQAYNNRGIAYFALGNLKQAITDYTEAIRVDAKYARAYTNRGTAQLALGNTQAAIADYTQGIRIDPKYAKAYENRGTVKSQLGKKQEAIQDLQKAADIYQSQGKTKDYQNIIESIEKLP
ncbi:tetratricopeptide repeat protein [Acaryochloris sp. 'Moss Beach']|uniref:serine/threonine-protein kinase n=1 Tax=Acaryochloris sp. 'Moss Beach' TaxID=2740837 RepID=UPI001F1EBC8C|nr:serine/threonine-protein kinase [Acaryochloris sp. 'Moss Beach']UJB69404.1 tetratricopeptide repeat protein [Acaryochloris sp. 'Moss Beach']